MPYYCTHVNVVSNPDWKGKLVTACESIILDDAMAFAHPFLRGLIDRLAHQYQLPLHNNFIVDMGDKSFNVVYLSTVNESGLEPSAEEFEQWRQGRIPLYCYKYSFKIEKMEAVSITEEEITKEIHNAS